MLEVFEVQKDECIDMSQYNSTTYNLKTESKTNTDGTPRKNISSPAKLQSKVSINKGGISRKEIDKRDYMKSVIKKQRV